jgi:hypothetical protein
MARSVWTILFAINVVLLVLLALSVPYVEPGTATYTITLLSFGIIGVSLVGLAVVLYIDWNRFRR